ncbi:MAG: hypothetical protein IT574_09150 [Candidatus Aureabacteria bacterium]|nr:hypothetical protein [Candidatus Auribacterota bacterium]NLW93320.1 hypothetical protein [Chlamydiota bacterium]HOE28001.1 hypothetical protein [bacterium]HQM51795.1 hypothetical protein [bacterium]
MVNIAINRAVHLARRDAHYRCCIRLLEQRFEETPLVKRRRRLEGILHHIAEAIREATCALRGSRGWRDERIFLKYLLLVCDGVRAALVMLEHEALLREEKGFLKRLLGGGAAILVTFEERSRSMEQEILDHVAQLVLYASSTYSALKKANHDSLRGADRERYRIAYEAVLPESR